MAKPLPPRKKDALRGSQFMTGIKMIYGPEYESAVIREVMSGNVPDFMRPENWREVTLTGTVDGMEVEIIIRVAPDYLAIGSNEDYVRVPLSPVALQRLAGQLDMALPTKKVVDAVYVQAKKENGLLDLIDAGEISRETGMKLDRSTKYMLSPEFAWSQSVIADGKIKQRNLPKYGIVCGQKKDVIIHQVPKEHRGNLVQYRPNHPQGLDYGAHPKDHSDYSLGARFVDQHVTVRIRGNRVTEIEARYGDIINDPKFYKILSDARFDIRLAYRMAEATVPVRRESDTPEIRKKLPLRRV
ncbi:hypothetical protein JXA56_04605 [Candidatus Micrarchaeota archaeon]|nr:hypothetical protein [Candidatus Micrarchaeota archaeon]